jgi:hypothetical protein
MGVLASKIRNAMGYSAQGRAAQQYQAGNPSAVDKAKVDQKADAKLKKKGA